MYFPTFWVDGQSQESRPPHPKVDLILVKCGLFPWPCFLCKTFIFLLVLLLSVLGRDFFFHTLGFICLFASLAHTHAKFESELCVESDPLASRPRLSRGFPTRSPRTRSARTSSTCTTTRSWRRPSCAHHIPVARMSCFFKPFLLSCLMCLGGGGG